MKIKILYNKLISYLRLPKFISKRIPQEYKKRFLYGYILLLILGVFLTLVYAFVPSFTTCSALFGTMFCTPTGIFIALFASLPGYLLAGNALSFLPDVPWIVSLISVIIVSGIFYYMVGKFLDRQKGKKFTTESFVRSVIILTLVILVLLLLALLSKKTG